MRQVLRTLPRFVLLLLLTDFFSAADTLSGSPAPSDATGSQASGGPAPGRTAVIVDSEGISTEVRGIHTENDDFVSADLVEVETSSLTIGIPIGSLISIETERDIATAKYTWRGQSYAASGTLPFKGVHLKGTSAFGSFDLVLQDVRRVTFNEAPAPNTATRPLPSESVIVLLDGSRVPVARLRAVHRFRGPYGFYSTRASEVLELRRGAGAIALEFQKIARLDFSQEQGGEQKISGPVNVTLAGGATSAATWDSGDLWGFTGEFERGYLFIRPQQLKAVEF
jgi:hypothetical protein